MNRYDDNWAGRAGTQWRVVLDGGEVRTTGRPVQVQLEEDDDEDYFAPLRSWTGKLTLMADAEEARALMPAGAQEAVATVTGAETLGGETGEAVPEWCGYVRPETLTQPWPGYAGTATLTLQSRLATAGGRYLDADGGRGFVTLGALLREALLLCGFSDSDAIAWPSRWATAAGEPGVSVLGLRVSRGRFFADNQGGSDTEEGTEVDTADGTDRTPFEVMTTADVAIEAVMRFFGYSLREHGGGLVAVCPGWTAYELTTIGALAGGAPAAGSFTAYTAETKTLYGRGGGEGEVSYLQGRKRVTVRTELAKLSGNLVPSVQCSGRKFVGSYNRTLWTPDEPSAHNQSAIVHVKVYELKDKAGDAVFRAYDGKSGADTLPVVETLASWKNADGGLDSSGVVFPNLHAPAEPSVENYPQRQGAFPVQLDAFTSAEALNPNSTRLPGTMRNYEYTEGFLVNPYRYENRPPLLGNLGPLTQLAGPVLTLRNRNATSWRGGAFILNFGVTAYQISRGLNREDPGPVSPAWNDMARIGILLKVGDYVWQGEYFADPVAEPIVYATVPIEDTSGKTWPAVAQVQDNKTLLMPYNGAGGLVMEFQDRLRKDLETYGDVLMQLYIVPRWQNLDVDPVQMLFFSDFSLEYREPDDEADTETAAASYEADGGTRTIYRKTRAGFTEDGYSATLQLSSRQEGASGALSTLLGADGRAIETLWDGDAGALVQPERGLLGFLSHYYDRVVERRQITEPLNGPRQFAPEAIYTFPGDGRKWALLARSEDHQMQQVRLTLIDVYEGQG